MSSLRNSLHRRNHKERSQLAHRARFGFLEKHKDYVLRARDYHQKQDRITLLRQKAAARNQDEFYFSMTREKTQGGVHVKDRGNVALPTDFVKLLKTQDENYVRTMRSSNLKKIDKIKAHLAQMVDIIRPDSSALDALDLDNDDLKTLQKAGLFNTSQGSSRLTKHIIFAEDEDEAAKLSQAGKAKATHTNTSVPTVADDDEDIDLGWKTITPSSKRKGKGKQAVPAKEENYSEDEEMDDGDSPADHTGQRLVKELAARLRRDQQLRYAIREFEMQRLLMGKGARKKIQGVEKVDGERDSDEDEDALDARGGRPQKSKKVVDEATYKPRVYKWRMERKK